MYSIQRTWAFQRVIRGVIDADSRSAAFFEINSPTASQVRDVAALAFAAKWKKRRRSRSVFGTYQLIAGYTFPSSSAPIEGTIRLMVCG